MKIMLFPTGDEGGDMHWVWPDENVVIYLPVPPPPTPAEIEYSKKLALHLKKTRRNNQTDTGGGPSWSDSSNITNTTHDVSKKKFNAYPNSESKEKVDYQSKEEGVGNNANRTTTTTAADNNRKSFTNPFTALHNHNNNNITVAASSDSLLEDVNKRLAEALLMTATTVTLSCAKLLRQGGRYCRRISDGDK